VSHLGLTRGREGSKANHTEVAEYYAATQKVERTSIPHLPEPEDIQPPEPPGAMARMKTENIIEYAKETGAQAVAAQMAKLGPVLETLTSQNDLLIAENARLRHEREQLMDSNSKLSRQNVDFKAVAKEMRELDLGRVLVQMYGATEAPNSTPRNKSRTFILPDGLTIEYTANQWQTQNGMSKGKGAVNLVMHLSGYGQDNYQQAVRELAEVFGDKDIAGTLAAHLVETAPREVKAIASRKFEMPKPCQRTWPVVFGYLTMKLKLPEPFVDQAHGQGLVFSDPCGNCVFARDQDSGVFKIGAGDKPFRQSLGKGGEPFVMSGSDGKVFVADSPLEALALKAMQPDSTVLATNGFMSAEKLKPYLEHKEIYLAQGQNKTGQEMARYLREYFPIAKRLQPGQSASWNEYRLLQIKELKDKEKQQAQATAKARAETLTSTPGADVSRSGGWSR